MDVLTEYEVKCSCGQKLAATIVGKEIVVSPCEHCMDAASYHSDLEGDS